MSELENAVAELAAAFEEFKSTNDKALEEKAEKGAVDVIVDEKLDRINDFMSEQEKKMAEIAKAVARPEVSANEEKSSEYKTAFEKFVRKGDETELKATALTAGIDADGGYAVPEEVDARVQELLIDLSPMRSICDVVRTNTSDWKRIIDVNGATSGWVAETTTPADKDVPSLAEVVPPQGILYTSLKASQVLLEDSFFSIENWLANSMATEFARAEGAAFLNGTGTDQPAGLLTETTATTADGVRAFGTLQHVATGVAADFPATDAAFGDMLIDVVHSLKAGHRANATWVMNKGVLGSIRKLTDSQGNYLWQPSMQAGVPSTLLGYNIAEMEDMPAVGANNLPIAFGNFRAGYTIVDRMGISTLRDPYSNKPYIVFYTTKRVGGKVMDTESIKFVKCEL